MRSRSISIRVIVITASAFLALVLTWRVYVSDLLMARSAAAVKASKSIEEVYRLTQRAGTIAGLDPRSYSFRGLAAYGVAVEADAQDRSLWFAIASRDLAEAVRRDPMDGVAFRALALTADGLDLSSEALRFAESSVARDPASPDNLWVLARLQPPGSEARALAYARVTALRPALTDSIVREVGGAKRGLEELARYIAPRGDTYVEWAHATTDVSRRGWIARKGLGYVNDASNDADRQYGWLYYYAGLEVMDTDPARAAELLKLATDHLPDTHALQRNYGFALLRTGDPESAREAFLRSTRLYSDLANSAHLGLAQANEELGEMERALATYRRLSETPRMEEWVKARARAGIRRIERSEH